MILPNVGALSDGQAAAIRRSVTNGGGLLATGESSRYDEQGQRRPDFALADLFQAHVVGVHHGSETDERISWDEWGQHTYLRLAPERRRWVDGPLTGAEPDDDSPRHPSLAGFYEADILPFGGRIEVARPAAGALMPLTLVPPFPIYPPETAGMRIPASRVPALVLNEANGGRVAYLAADLDRTFGRSRLPDHAALLAILVRWTASDRIPLRVEGAGFLHCQLYRQGERLILHVVNLTGYDASIAPAYDYFPVGPLTISVSLERSVGAVDVERLVAGDRLDVASNAGWHEFTVGRIVDHEVFVIGPA